MKGGAVKRETLPEDLLARFYEIRPAILKRLGEFAQVAPEKYFYELCFCICTPQSRARNAFAVQSILEERNFLLQPFDPAPVLADRAHYIRFHNQKARNLLEARNKFPLLENILVQPASAPEKRMWLVNNLRGVGMKEASHFLRNIGYRNLAILDRHILRHLANLGAFDQIPMVATIGRYLEAEKAFFLFAQATGISMDELDLFFWSLETGEILK